MRLTSGAFGRRLLPGMMGFFNSSAFLRRSVASSALIAVVGLAFGFCVCEMPVHSEGPECHEARPTTVPAHGVWSQECCCSGDPTLQPATLEARGPETARTVSHLPSTSALPAVMPEVEGSSRAAAAPWLVAASPPHAPPPAFVLPLRV